MTLLRPERKRGDRELARLALIVELAAEVAGISPEEMSGRISKRTEELLASHKQCCDAVSLCAIRDSAVALGQARERLLAREG